MQATTDLKLVRLKNLASAACINRIVDRDRFGSDDDLKEIGLLTMYFADLEGSLALYCEMLLSRPELGGFHHPKPVIERRFSEKLDLYKTLVVAIGVLRSIKTDLIEETIGRAREVGERRNNIIHGYLHIKQGGDVVFWLRGYEVRADLNGLRTLNLQVLEVTEAVAKALTGLFKQLVKVAPTQAQIETPIINVLEANLLRVESAIKRCESHAAFEASNKELVAARNTVRSSRARLRAAEGRLPAEYRELFVERKNQFQRCAAIAERIKKTGIDDPQLEDENAKLTEIDERLQKLGARCNSEPMSRPRKG